MYESYWGLRESPFRSAADPRCFYCSPMHEEALARLQFLVENDRRLGLLLGDSGSGKTLLLRVLAEQLRRQAVQVAVVSLLGIEPSELLWEIASQLGIRPCPSDQQFVLWRQVVDRLAENRYQRQATALLLDDAGEASAEVLTYVTRLLQADPAADNQVTLVLALEDAAVERLGRRLLEMCDLRIVVDPWSEAEVEAYLEAAVDRAGGRESLFEPSAARRLFELTGGLPRYINQLGGLALLAAADRGLLRVDAELIDSAFDELSVTLGEGADAQLEIVPLPQPSPRSALAP